MTEWILFGLTALLLLMAAATIAVSLLGVYRFNFALNRMHAASMIDTLGMLFVVLALCISTGFGFALLKLLLVLCFLWIGSPVASHLVSRLEVLTDSELNRHLTLIDRTGGKKK